MAYQTVIQYMDVIYDARTAAAETIQRWWTAVRYIHVNRRMVVVAHTQNKGPFRTELRSMVSYMFEDKTAQTVDYLIETTSDTIFNATADMNREILEEVVRARTFCIMLAANDEVAAADTSFIPTQWIVLGHG